MTALTSDIAKFVAALQSGAVPERCSYGARIGMLDCVGTMIAGADEEAVKLVARIVPTSTTNDGAPEIPGGRNLSAPDAALVNGVAAHVLDYDDTHSHNIIHPAGPVISAILALSEHRPVSGHDFVTALVTGVDVEERDINKTPPSREFLEQHVDEQRFLDFVSTRSPVFKERPVPTSKKDAIDLMTEQPNLIKRPILIKNSKVIFGFDKNAYDTLKAR